MAYMGMSFGRDPVGSVGVSCMVRDHEDCFREFSDDDDGEYREGE